MWGLNVSSDKNRDGLEKFFSALIFPLVVLGENPYRFLTSHNICLAPSFLREPQRCNAAKWRCAVQESRTYFRFNVLYSALPNQIEI